MSSDQWLDNSENGIFVNEYRTYPHPAETVQNHQNYYPEDPIIQMPDQWVENSENGIFVDKYTYPNPAETAPRKTPVQNHQNYPEDRDIVMPERNSENGIFMNEYTYPNPADQTVQTNHNFYPEEPPQLDIVAQACLLSGILTEDKLYVPIPNHSVHQMPIERNDEEYTEYGFEYVADEVSTSSHMDSQTSTAWQNPQMMPTSFKKPPRVRNHQKRPDFQHVSKSRWFRHLVPFEDVPKQKTYVDEFHPKVFQEGELMEYMNQPNPEYLDTVSLVKELAEVLDYDGISRTSFARTILDRSSVCITNIMKRPKAYENLREGKAIYARIDRWMRLDQYDRKSLCCLSNEEAWKVIGRLEVAVRGEKKKSQESPLQFNNSNSPPTKQIVISEEQRDFLLQHREQVADTRVKNFMEKAAFYAGLPLDTVKHFYRYVPRHYQEMSKENWPESVTIE